MTHTLINSWLDGQLQCNLHVAALGDDPKVLVHNVAATLLAYTINIYQQHKTWLLDQIQSAGCYILKNHTLAHLSDSSL